MADGMEAAGAAAAEGELTLAPERRIAVAVDESEEKHVRLGLVPPQCPHGDDPEQYHPSLRATSAPRLPFPRRHRGRSGEGEKMRTLLKFETYSPFNSCFPFLSGAGYLFSNDVITTMEKYSKDLAESVMERAKKVYKDYDNVKVEAKVATGDARDVICELVGKVGADLLVMGSHGYGFHQEGSSGERQRLLRPQRQVPSADRRTPCEVIIGMIGLKWRFSGFEVYEWQMSHP